MATTRRVGTAGTAEAVRTPTTLFTTNLAWRVEIVTPSPELSAKLTLAAKRPDLAPQFVPLVHALRQALPAGDPRLETEVLYTSWGLAALKALQAEVATRRR